MGPAAGKRTRRINKLEFLSHSLKRPSFGATKAARRQPAIQREEGLQRFQP